MKPQIREFFSEVSSTYERINHLLTLGFDIRWRRTAVDLAIRGDGTRWLDVCTGTGETARMLQQRKPTGCRVFAADFSLPMLREFARRPDSSTLPKTIAECSALPFPSGCFDLVTLSFATRNINSSPDAFIARLREINRILAPGGRFVNLETSQPPSPVVRKLFHLIVAVGVPPLGRLVSGVSAPYRYLAASIPRFHDADRLAAILRSAGFMRVEYHRLFLGAACIHIAYRRPPGASS